MTMTFSIHDSIDSSGMLDRSDLCFGSSHGLVDSPSEETHILRGKLQIPASEGLICRSRLESLFTKSVQQFPATLIAGRAGTGKTMLAAQFAEHFKRVCWYSIDSTDISWRMFSKYFSASISDNQSGSPADGTNGNRHDESEIASFLLKNLSNFYGKPAQKSLIVLDDIHHIFEAVWFDDFFKLLLYSLPSNTHLLLLCRSKPLGPLWRLRSKQMLNVIEEKVLAFTIAETEALFDSKKISPKHAKEASNKYFGRISKLLQFTRDIRPELTA